MLPLHNMEMSLVRAATVDHLDVQRLWRTSQTPHWIGCSEELAPSLTTGNTWKSRPCALPRQDSKAVPYSRCVGELGHSSMSVE